MNSFLFGRTARNTFCLPKQTSNVSLPFVSRDWILPLSPMAHLPSLTERHSEAFSLLYIKDICLLIWPFMLILQIMSIFLSFTTLLMIAISNRKSIVATVSSSMHSKPMIHCQWTLTSCPIGALLYFNYFSDIAFTKCTSPQQLPRQISEPFELIAQLLMNLNWWVSIQIWQPAMFHICMAVLFPQSRWQPLVLVLIPLWSLKSPIIMYIAQNRLLSYTMQQLSQKCTMKYDFPSTPTTALGALSLRIFVNVVALCKSIISTSSIAMMAALPPSSSNVILLIDFPFYSSILSFPSYIYYLQLQYISLLQQHIILFSFYSFYLYCSNYLYIFYYSPTLNFSSISYFSFLTIHEIHCISTISFKQLEYLFVQFFIQICIQSGKYVSFLNFICYYVIMQLSSFEDKILFTPEEELDYEPTPYLSPFICPSIGECMGCGEQLPDLQLQPQETTEKGQPQLMNCIYIQEPQFGKLEFAYQSQGTETILNGKQLKTEAIITLTCQSKIKSLISLLVENDQLRHEQLQKHGARICQSQHVFKQVFQILLNKFKKLKKTKQEMTKYCMRKAFKFVNDLKNLAKEPYLKKKNSSKNYDDQQSQCILEVPFKKNSAEKTMNAQFLKQVFCSRQFVAGYKKFLQKFPEMINQDNKCKIDFLCQTIENCLKTHDLKKIQSLKRLPWPRSILVKTEQLSFQLLDFAKQTTLQELKSSDSLQGRA